MRINHSGVPIVALLLLTALKIKSFTNPRVILTSPNAVLNAVKKGSQSATETVATTINRVRCFLQYAPSVGKLLRYHSSPAEIDRFIVATATIRSG